MSDPHRLSASARRGSRLAGQVLGGGADTDDLAAVVDAERRGEGEYRILTFLCLGTPSPLAGSHRARWRDRLLPHVLSPPVVDLAWPSGSRGVQEVSAARPASAHSS